MKFFDVKLIPPKAGCKFYIAETPEWCVAVERLAFSDLWVATLSRSPGREHPPSRYCAGADPVRCLENLQRFASDEVYAAFTKPPQLRFQNTELTHCGFGHFAAQRGEFLVFSRASGSCFLEHTPSGKQLLTVVNDLATRQGNLDELAKLYAGEAFE